MSDFLKSWFSGFEKGLKILPEEERNKLLCECGIACSESYSLDVYKKIWYNSNSVSDFFALLNSGFEDVSVIEVEKNTTYEIYYSTCLCDLYTQGYIKSGEFCECSRRSLLYNLNNIIPDSKVQVELVDSILRGGEKCILRITIE